MFFAGSTATPNTGELIVALAGMRSDEGSVVYAIWSGQEGWLDANPLYEGSAPIVNGLATIRIAQAPYGEYAVSVYHDRNGNKKLDTGLFGIPKEAIGTSNDAKVRFGPPKYEDARFVLSEPEMIIAIPVRKLF